LPEPRAIPALHLHADTKEASAVAPHDRTAPDKTERNNWSAKGNVNPETGKKGDKPVTK
jgi:hypothetical protein